MRYHVYGRTEFVDPLAHVEDVEIEGEPSVAAAGVGRDWLELVLVPAERVEWILRDGELVRELGAAAPRGAGP